MDKVYPLKLEDSVDGSQDDEMFPSETRPSEDYIVAKGFVLEDSDDHRMEIVDNEVALVDPINGVKKLSQIGSGAGSDPYNLLFNVAQNNHTEVVRTSGKVSSIIVWTDVSKTQKIRESIITRTLGKVTQVVTNQYDSIGALKETLTQTINRAANQVTSISTVKT